MKVPNLNARFSGILMFLAASGLVLAQQNAPTGGWRRIGDAPPATAQSTAPPDAQQQDPSQPVDRGDDYGQPNPNDPQANQPKMNQNMRPSYGLPPQVTVKPNTFLTVRINQPLSSDHNQAGDTFTATLLQPLIADGVVVAQRGQTIYGRVALAEKARTGRDSRLGLQLTSLTTVDGTQHPVQSQLVAQQGPRTPGSVQAGTVVGTTAVGAAIGGAAAWGTGAAIGAGAGAFAGLAAVLLTRNHETRIFPESVLTFETTSPVTVSTVNAPQAFRFVGPEDFDRPSMQYNTAGPGPGGPGPGGPGPMAPGYYAPAPGFSPYYGVGYPYPYPYFWGPSVVIGGGWGWGGWGRGVVVRGGFRRIR